MAHRTGVIRNQLLLLPPSLDELIGEDNPVRIIDVFVNALDLEKAGFSHSIPAELGCPPFNPADMLKLYLYGYSNRIRSSRKLEKECVRNIELIWLLNKLQPKYRTIAYFRANNSKALKEVFRQFIVMIKRWDLISGDLLSVDGSKFRAVNSKKNNYNQRKIERHLKYIDEKVDEYLNELEKNDHEEQGERRVKVKECLQQLEKRRQKYLELEEHLKKMGEEQVSTTDPEAKQLMIRGQITEVAYNAQVTVDSKHNLVIDTLAINSNDRKILSTMGSRAKQIIEKENIELLADKGYHNGEELQKCELMNIKTYVAPQETTCGEKIPTEDYRGDKFTYNVQDDCYTCPEGEVLTTSGRWFKKTSRKHVIPIKQYKTKACRECTKRKLCTKSPIQRGRVLERSEYQDAVYANNQRVQQETEKYRRRQMMSEHPFGVVKRQWGYDHVLMKGLQKVDTEISLMFLCYDLKRVMNIMGFKGFIEAIMNFYQNLCIHFWRGIEIPLKKAVILI
ncbi:MAG: IS1182 family transposase [Syntrophaceae bacterium]|nr:IS1182 family transposase [Syntrophaceae bacterium]